LNSGDLRGQPELAALNAAKPFDGLSTLFFSARAKAEIASLLERRAALATSGVEPGELAGALSGAQTEEGAAKLLPEVEASTSGTTVGVGVGILNLVNLIFWITFEKKSLI
jgi:hypothetical protein